MHTQLKELWRTNVFLRDYHLPIPINSPSLPPKAAEIGRGDAPASYPAPVLLSQIYDFTPPYKFVPLVIKESHLFASLRILCLRRDGYGVVAAARDLDNRIKTLIDALTMPTPAQGLPQLDGTDLMPSADEDPFFALLDDDRQVTHLEVETDTALDPSPYNPEDLDFVRLLISVEVRPSIVNGANLPFL